MTVHRRHFVDNAPTTTLVSSINNTSDVTFAVTSLIGFPSSLPYLATIDRGTASAEQVEVTNVVGNTVTVTRNVNGQGIFSHTSASKFEHTANAQDYDEANSHIMATTDVHGVSGALVDTGTAQTLSNKILNGNRASFNTTGANSALTLATDTNTTKSINSKNAAGTTTFSVDGNGAVAAGSVTGAAGSFTTLNASGATVLSSTLSVSGASTLAGTTVSTLHATSTSVLDGAVTINSTITSTGNASFAGTTVTTLHATGAVTFDTTLSVSGASTIQGLTATTGHFTGAVTNDSTLTNTGAATFGAGVTVTGGLTASSTDIVAAVTPTLDTSVGTAQSGFTGASAYVITMGANNAFVMFSLALTTTNTLTATNGNITDKTCFIVDAAYHPTQGTVPLTLTNQAVSGSAWIDTGGNVVIVAASDDLAAGTLIRISGCWVRP